MISKYNLATLIDDVRSGWAPPDRCATLPWLEQNFRIPSEESENSGLYDASMVPYFWGVMHALDCDDVEMVVLMKAAQIGWTLLVTGWLGKRICTEPTRILGLFPKDEKARDFIEEKFEPVIKSTPKLSRLIDVSQSRKSGNRTLKKNFPGGYLKVFGSNSVSNVKSTPSPVVIVEEPDDTNANVGDQGDAISLARERSKTFTNSKFVIGGTPSLEGVSEMAHYTKLSSQRELPIGCHECGEKHVLDWDNVSWHEAESGDVHPIFKRHQPETAIYTCPYCAVVWDDWQRKENVLNTCQKARASGDAWCGWVSTVASSAKVEGFKELSELYICMPSHKIENLVRDYLEAEHKADSGEENGRIVFRNSKLGRTYEYKSDDDIDHEQLKELADDYNELECPPGGLKVCAGVDVQDDRLAIVIRAYGRDMESWLLYWGEIYGNTVDAKDPIYKELSAILFNGFKHERLGRIFLSSVSIDSSDGGTNQAVYSWVRRESKKQSANIMAIKGSSNDSGRAEIFSMPRKLDHTNHKRTTKADRHQVKVYIVGTHKAKDIISKRLCGTSAFMHSYAGARADYWEQVKSEIKAPSKKLKGARVWQKKSGVRNEGLDCEVYCLHSAIALKLHTYNSKKWDIIDRQLSQKDMFDAADGDVESDSPDDDTSEKSTKNKSRARRRRGFISGVTG